MGASGTFFERIDRLIAEAGEGDLVGRVVVDQVYAQNQHESSWFKHPRGGQDHYLRDPLFDKVDQYMQHLADHLVTPNGSEIKEAMSHVVEDLSDQVEIRAPREFGDLESSGHPIVYDQGAVIYDRPPKTRRLSRDDLRLKARGLHHGGSSRARGRRRRSRLEPKP